MAKLTLSQKIIQFLKNNPNQKFTARQIAEAIYALHTDDFKAKRAKFNDDTAFIQQLVAEIGSSKPLILNKNPNIQTQDEPRPRLYWYETNLHQTDHIQDENSQNNEDNHKFNEHQLYPLLMQYLHNELDLYCLRIDEKSSSNTRGKNGNQWLHPDIVAMQALAKDWHIDIQSCIQGDIGQNIRL